MIALKKIQEEEAFEEWNDMSCGLIVPNIKRGGTL
jgi:hypothetical protein